MNLQQESKITMYKSIEQHLDAAPTVVDSVSALQAFVGSYKALLAGINDTALLVVRPVNGISANKAVTKTKLADAAARLAVLLRAYSAETGNNTLARDADYTRYGFSKMRDEALGPICRTILDRLREHRAALSDYGVTDEKIAALESALDAFQSNLVAPRAALGSRKTHNERLRLLMRQSDELLTNRIDNLIENFRETHPDFYETYFNLRNVNRRGNRITQLRGTVTDGATGTPIKNASVTIGGKTVTTNSLGEYSIKPIPPGKQTLKVEAEGYQTFENDETQIAPGELKRSTTTLTPAS